MLLTSLAIATLPLWQLPVPGDDLIRRSYIEPIDALSVQLQAADDIVTVRGRMQDGTWTNWQEMTVDDEQEPGLLESSLVMFPEDVTAIEVDGVRSSADLHPIAVDDTPASYTLAGPDPGTPHILSREDWGANDDLLFTDNEPSGDSSTDAGDNGDAAPSSDREQKCLQAQKDYPAQFKTTRTTPSINGSTLRWAHTYSKEIDLLLVHHTAVQVSGDTRSGVERIRALYAYHAQNRGWGDIGYHYLIDEEGQIYEGKAGGKYVVGGHAYCNNVNTIGVALLGNFEVEKPSQDQMKALQWLLSDLGDTYNIDLDDNASFHGELFSSPILGHGDVLSTACPGFYVRQTLSQVRKNVENNDLEKNITFPKKPTSSRSSSSRSSVRSSSRSSRSATVSSKPAFREGVSILGSATLGGRPGGEVPFSVRYTTAEKGATAGQRIADVKRSDPIIKVWQLIGDEYVAIRGHITTETSVPRNSATAIQLKVQIPRDRGTYTLSIGNAKFTLQPSGRVTEPGTSAMSVHSTRSSSSSSSISRRPFSARSSASSVSSSSRSPNIRIRLESRDAGLASCNDADLTLLRTLYRGTVECQMIDNKPAIINDVSLDDYLMGLAEEPDTEPYEKQRAFAIAARTYAAHYMQSTYRKFPGKPYDGSDNPANFQKYTGKSFEKNNPRWLDAVEDTANLIISKDNKIIRPPYFSSNDGRTKTPQEAGWGTSFPFAEIFTSKPDPWCEGMDNRGHGVGMSGCGAEGQANEGKTGEEILDYYYPGTTRKSVTGFF